MGLVHPIEGEGGKDGEGGRGGGREGGEGRVKVSRPIKVINIKTQFLY